MVTLSEGSKGSMISLINGLNFKTRSIVLSIQVNPAEWQIKTSRELGKYYKKKKDFLE
jgi:hypothetical protein